MNIIHKIRWDGLKADLITGKDYCSIDLNLPRRTLSSSVLGGGLSSIERVLNLKVKANPEGVGENKEELWESPETTLRNFALEKEWNGPLAGMMTSAYMKSLQYSVLEESWGGVFCMLTAGISNARAAGDAGEFPPEVKGRALPQGTINIMVGTNVRLSDAALTEAVMIITEAKVAVLNSFDIRSPLSGKPATGTGTDSVLITSGSGPKAVFCGKHTKLGQIIGEAVTEALSASLQYYKYPI